MMRKFIPGFRSKHLLLHSPLSQKCQSNPDKSLLSSIPSSFAFSHDRACSSTPEQEAKTSVLSNYLISTLKFSKSRALTVTNQYSYIKSLEKPEKTVLFFKGVGFSDAQVKYIASHMPSLLFASVEKTLKPKFVFLQELGLSGPRIGDVISRNPNILNYSLDRSLKPTVLLIKEVLTSDGKNRSEEKVRDDLCRILMRSNRISSSKSNLEANIDYLKSCGVCGSQLSVTLLQNPGLFVLRKEKILQLVKRALDMDFTMGSRMLVYGVLTLSRLSVKTLSGKFEVFGVFGFSEAEIVSMFRKSPIAFHTSKEMLRSKLELYLSTLGIDKTLLVQHPVILSCSAEKRVIPRYRVVEKLKSMGLLSKGSSFYSAMCMSNKNFLEKYILRFEKEADELMLAYNGQLVNTSEKKEVS
ncbi:hypothetical protein ABFS83_08G232900 [Erythranthe nasuta]